MGFVLSASKAGFPQFNAREVVVRVARTDETGKKSGLSVETARVQGLWTPRLGMLRNSLTSIGFP